LSQVAPRISPDTGGTPLEQDTDKMINLVMRWVLDNYFEALTALGNKAFSVTARDMLNNRIDDALGNAGQCAAPAPVYACETCADVAVVCAIMALVVAAGLYVAGILQNKGRHGARTFSIGSRSSSRSRMVTAEQPHFGEAEVQPTAEMAKPSTSGTDTTGNGTSAAGTMASTTVGSGSESSMVNSLDGIVEEPMQRSVSQLDNGTAWDSLAFTRDINTGLRWGLPVAIVANMILFLSGNLGVGTSVMASITANGSEVVSLPPVKSFGLANSIRDMWAGRVYALALMIAFFSGCWPYFKLILMLVCWYLPTKFLSSTRRYAVLQFLDVYGKWSLVDTYVLVLMMVAFRFHIDDTYGVPEVHEIFDKAQASGSLTVYVQPSWEFSAFLVATLLSLVLGHVMCGCHRFVVGIGEYAPHFDRRDMAKSRLCNKLRELGMDGGIVHAHGPTICLSISLLLVILGIFLDTFQFRFEGLAAYILGPEDAVRRHSVLSLAGAIPPSTAHPNSFEIRWIQGVFLIFTFVVTVAYHVLLICLWCLPIAKKHQRHLLIAAQIMNAWSALDVFVVSILASVLEISLFVELQIIGDKCDGIDAVLSRSRIASKLPGKITCFDVVSELQPGFFILFFAMLISWVTGSIVLQRCSRLLLAPPNGSLNGGA